MRRLFASGVLPLVRPLVGNTGFVYSWSMTELCLVRHGETDWNQQRKIQGYRDIPLNARGRAQAGLAAEYLAGEKWDWMYSSPLSRAYDTASAIAERVGIRNIRVDQRLRERSFGEAEGIDVNLYREKYSGAPIPGAETWEDVQARAVEVINYLAMRHPDSRVLAVAHGGFISVLLALLSNGEINPRKEPLKNVCMNMFEYDGAWRILWYNRVTPELEVLTARTFLE